MVEQGGDQVHPSRVMLDPYCYLHMSGYFAHTFRRTRAFSALVPFCATLANAFAAWARSWIG